MLHRISLSLFLVLTVNANANTLAKKFLNNEENKKFHVMTSIQNHGTTIVSEASDSSVASEEEFSIIAQTITGEYFVNDQFSIVGGYYFALVVDIDAEIQGFDLGAQYYPLSNGHVNELKFMGSTLTSYPEWSPYIYFGASTRDYQFSTVSLKFQGINLKAGTNWYFHEKYFLKGEAFYQQHLNNNVRTLTTTGIGIGIGMPF